MKRIGCILLAAMWLFGMTGCTEPAVDTDAPIGGGMTTTTTATKPTVTITDDLLLPVEDYSWEREEEITHIVLHFTSAVTISPTDPYNYDTIRQIFVDNQVSAHYLLNREGAVTRLVADDRAAWHAGKGTWGDDEKYTNKMNKYAIGIEIMNIGSYRDMAQYLTRTQYDALDDELIGFTDEQYETLAALVDELCEKYDIPKDREHILGHSEYNPAKSDPGENFDWSKIGL